MLFGLVIREHAESFIDALDAKGGDVEHKHECVAMLQLMDVLVSWRLLTPTTVCDATQVQGDP